MLSPDQSSKKSGKAKKVIPDPPDISSKINQGTPKPAKTKLISPVARPPVTKPAVITIAVEEPIILQPPIEEAAPITIGDESEVMKSPTAVPVPQSPEGTPGRGRVNLT